MRYIFGDYRLDTQGYELRCAGQLIPLGPQVFNVLTYLVAQRDRVVSRDELFAHLWPNQFVTEDALERCIRAARSALEDRPEAPQYITTTRGRGYRFIAPVQEQPPGPSSESPRARRLQRWNGCTPVLASCVSRWESLYSSSACCWDSSMPMVQEENIRRGGR